MLVVADILAFLPGDLHCDYDDGTFEWFDGTKICILEPAAAMGKLIIVHHGSPLPKDSLWRVIGATLQFEINPDKFSRWITGKSGEIFSGGLKNLALVENK